MDSPRPQPVSRETEDALYRRVLNWLTKYLGRVRDLLRATFQRFGTAPDPHTVYEASPIWTSATSDIVKGLTGIAGTNANDPIVASSLAMTTNLIKGIPDEVYRMVMDQIVQGSANGETPEQLTVRVDTVLSTTGSQRWQGRARMIAATELSRYWNSNIYASALAVQHTNTKLMTKEWVSHHDDRVRSSHLKADGQTVPLSQPFTVGQSLLMYPADPMGPADEIISCRCGLKIK